MAAEAPDAPKNNRHALVELGLLIAVKVCYLIVLVAELEDDLVQLALWCVVVIAGLIGLGSFVSVGVEKLIRRLVSRGGPSSSSA